MHLLLTGGIGYIGSHLARLLRAEGHDLVVVDDLSSGHPETLPDGVVLVEGRCGDPEVLRAAAPEGVDGIMHLAARCSVGESMRDPDLYYRANLQDGLGLLEWLVDRGVPWIVHSSTCAVYGHPESHPIDEETCPRPINPYGATKLALDRAIDFYAQAYGIRGVSLRYFNAAGAHPDGDLGEDKVPRSNLIPRLLDVALEQVEALEIYGDDYATPDGTGVRDYVHVMDLARAHLASLEHLEAGGSGGVFNLGTGAGHSVLEVVDAARRVTGRPLPTRKAPRRPGDPAELVADPGRAHRVLGWRAERSDLDTMLADAWAWRRRHPAGYATAEVGP